MAMRPSFLLQCTLCVSIVIIVFFSGIYCGVRMIGYSQSYNATLASVPTISLERIVNQQLEGQVHGSVRFILGDERIELHPNTPFRIPATVLLTHYTEIEIPEGMLYVASKKGKKYYPVASRAAQSITPSNRQYFATAQEAVQAGYVQ